MGWDSAPPSTDELTAPATGWDAAPPTQQEMDSTNKSLAGFGRNLLTDVKETGTGLGHLAQGIVEHPVDTVVNTVKGAPGALMNEGKRLGIGELLTGHPINAVEKLGNAFYDKPLTTGLEVAPVVGAAGKALGLGAEGAESAELGAEAAKSDMKAGAEEDVLKTAAKEAPEAAEGATKASAEAGAGAEAEAGAAASDPMAEVKDYISSKYGNLAKKPGWSDTVADYLDRYAQDMSAKNLGAAPGQIRQIGPEAGRAVGKAALDKGFTAPSVGDIGLEAKVKDLVKTSGAKIGAFRDEADALRDATKNPIDVLQEVRSRLDPKYGSGRGVHSGESAAYKKALEEVEDAQASHKGLAEVPTKLNQYAVDNKLTQPKGPYTDVANIVSQVNNERIKALLGTEKAAQYDEALRDFGLGKKMEHFLLRKGSREVGGRLGPGGGLRHTAQVFLDQIGYKYGAKVADRMATAIRSNPEIAKDLPSLFKEFGHHVYDAAEAEEPGMAHGGIVGAQELNHFLTSKYGKGDS